MPRSTLWIGVRVPRQITSQPFKEITQYDLACSGADDSRNFKGARTDCLKPECSVCQVNSEGEFEFSDSTFMWGGKHSRHSGLSSPKALRPRSGGESPTAGTTRDACADLHRVRRKSSVNGNWRLSSFGGATIMPAVWPVRSEERRVG